MGGLDTIVLTHRYENALQLRREWQAAKSARWNPTTKMREDGWLHLDAGAHGWWLDYLPERNVLEITLLLPKVMGQEGIHLALCNYPIRAFRPYLLGGVSCEIEREVGLHRGIGQRGPGLDWDAFGVRSAHYTIDLPVRDKTLVLRTLKSYQRSGKQRCWGDQTIQWTTGGKVVQTYDKEAQLRALLNEDDLREVVRRHPELPLVVRFEVRLGSTELRKLFGLPTGSLPKLGLVVRPDVVQGVLGREFASGFKLRRISAGKARSSDMVTARADDIVRLACDADMDLSYAHVCQLLVTTALIENHKKREISERYDVSMPQLSKLLSWARRLGLAPGVGTELSSRRAIGDLVRAFQRVYPSPVRPVSLTHAEKLAHSVDASWLVEPDCRRPVEGIIVDVHGEEDVLDAALFAAIQKSMG